MSFLNSVWLQILSIANLSDHIDTEAAGKSIRSNIFFKGPNAWILAFSIIIASVGLNVNSIPVIIGAMLISPLMGPIFGLGLGLGINDTMLLKDALKNLVVMVIISLVASFLYFLITPLSLANPTELLARTNPTIYDVLIALFGGFAGIFEQCRKEKGTVFSGVAIATALMPPLCTAGFGLASGNLVYFVGALYLFFINCIFITVATYIAVKYFQFSNIEFADEKTGHRTKRIVSIITLVMIIPSIWSAFVMIKENNFGNDVNKFVEANKARYGGYIYDYEISHHKGSKVEIFIAGEPLTANEKEEMIKSAESFGIAEDQLTITEYSTSGENRELEIVKGIYERTDSEISKRDSEIKVLEEKLRKAEESELPYAQITKEVVSQYPDVKEMFISKGANVQSGTWQENKGILIVVKAAEPMSENEKSTLTNWLKIRLETENIMLYVI